jgi:hypothetical protein
MMFITGMGIWSFLCKRAAPPVLVGILDNKEKKRGRATSPAPEQKDQQLPGQPQGGRRAVNIRRE